MQLEMCGSLRWQILKYALAVKTQQQWLKAVKFVWVWKRVGVNEIRVARVSCIFTAFLFNVSTQHVYFIRNSIVKHQFLYIFVTSHSVANCSVREYKQYKIYAKFSLQVNKRNRLVIIPANVNSRLFKKTLTVKYSRKKHKIGSCNQGEEQISEVPGEIHFDSCYHTCFPSRYWCQDMQIKQFRGHYVCVWRVVFFYRGHANAKREFGTWAIGH